MSSLKEGVKEQFEREIDITKAIKEDLENIHDVLYECLQNSSIVTACH